MKKTLFKRCLNRVLNLLVRFSPGSTSMRPRLHRWRGVRVGRDVFIGDEVYIDNEYPENIEIQDGAAISIRAIIVAHNKGPGRVIIEREAFVGPQVVILCGSGKTLRIGQGAVISAGCVITRNVAPGTVILPAPTQVAGHASISIASAKTIEEFWSGLRPVRSANANRGAKTAEGAGTPGANRSSSETSGSGTA